MTWHQWHHTASRSSRTNLCSRAACAKTCSDHGCHSIAWEGACACDEYANTRRNARKPCTLKVRRRRFIAIGNRKDRHADGRTSRVQRHERSTPESFALAPPARAYCQRRPISWIHQEYSAVAVPRAKGTLHDRCGGSTPSYRNDELQGRSQSGASSADHVATSVCALKPHCS